MVKGGKMKKLTKEEKKQIIRELRATGWTGSLNEDSLLLLAQKILNKQLEK